MTSSFKIDPVTASRIVARSELQGIIDSCTTSALAFRAIQNMAARLAESLPPEHDDAANLLIAFAMLVRVSDSRALLDTFADLVDGMPPDRASGVDGDTPAEGESE